MIDRLKRLWSMTSPNARYDINEGAEPRARRAVSPEFANESGPTGQLNDWNMLTSTARARDLYRNYTQAKALLIQFKLHCIGRGNLLYMTTADEDWNIATQDWYNKTWAPDCDARDDRNLHDLNAMLLMSVLREHDCVAFFDAFGVADPKFAGRMWFWETDQICNLEKKDWKDHAEDVAAVCGVEAAGMTQESGIVSDRWGQVCGYIVNSKRGQVAAKWKFATVMRRGPARLFKNSWRLNDHRGKSELLTAAAQLVDNYDILQAELQGAKTAGKWVGVVKTEESHWKSIGRADSGDTSTEIDITDSDAAAYTNYKNLEKILNGALEYMSPGDDVDLKVNPRLGGALDDYLTHQSIMTGASMGLPRLYSLLKADASFSATRTEKGLGDACFASWHAWLERYPLSWEAVNAIEYGMRTGAVVSKPAAEWVHGLEFDHPKQPPIQEMQHANANEKFLASGEKTLRDLVGPDWKRQIDQRDKEFQHRQSKIAKAKTANGGKAE